jgi:hypothetical protein
MAARSCSYRARIAQECVELCIIQVPEARLVFPDVSVRENPLLGCVGTTGGGGDAIRRAGDIGRDLADGIAQSVQTESVLRSVQAVCGGSARQAAACR